MPNTFCPVCGYDLKFEAWKGGLPSDEICVSCGNQFGYDDAIRFNGREEDISLRYNLLRQKWIDSGMNWRFPGDKFDRKPLDWNPVEQLKNIGVYLDGKN